jgi:hypothetical protein
MARHFYSGEIVPLRICSASPVHFIFTDPKLNLLY